MMARLSSFRQLVSLSSLCSMRSSRYQLSTMGKPKLPTALKISLVSTAVRPAQKLNPYNVVGKALALFKAAGLPVPAYGEDEKRRRVRDLIEHLVGRR